MRNCPACGQPIVTVPAAPLMVLRSVELTRRQRQILDVLIETYPRPVRSDFIIGRVYDDESNEFERPENAVQSHISKMRPQLRQVGIDIFCRRYSGYRLVLPSAETLHPAAAPYTLRATMERST